MLSSNTTNIFCHDKMQVYNTFDKTFGFWKYGFKLFFTPQITLGTRCFKKESLIAVVDKTYFLETNSFSSVL
jgi:hypothetical protein